MCLKYYLPNHSARNIYLNIQMKKKTTRGGKREGAGRPSQGKKNYTVSLTAENVKKAKAREGSFSGLLDRLLAAWLSA
jgi:hypothetical protein